jgi:pyruvate formate lyase activating enzyme
MRIGGLEKHSAIDYPGYLTAIVFTVGCNFRCPYCHNPELVDETAAEIPEAEVLAYLEKRQGLLEAVTITGGEPTMHADLPEFIKAVRALGYRVKLDSNGTNPARLRSIIAAGLVDYIAMDIKAPLPAYERTVARPVDPAKLAESIALIMESGVDYEFRTTVIKSLLPKEDFPAIGEANRGARRYYLQQFVPVKLLNPAFRRKTTYTDAELEEIKSIMADYVAVCEIR